jgi:hypothetical protein
VAPNGARPSTVPLEAGIGPANPPCPACGEPLFGWATAPDAAPVRRCEACGLGVVGDPGDEAEALAGLERLRIEGGDDPRYRIANRASLQASLGGSGWALIEAGSRYLFTAEAVRRLASGRDQQVARVRWRAGASVVSMWGTLLNSFTWGRNVALGALGRAVATPAGRPWQRAIDTFISVVATPLVLLAAVLMETGGALAGRGGVLELTLRLE